MSESPIRRRLFSSKAPGLLLTCAALVACSDDAPSAESDTSSDVADGADSVSADASTTDAEDPDAAPDAAPTLSVCEALALPVLPRDTAGPFGSLRHDLADDFTMPLADGSTWTFADAYTGCESYAFIPDTIPVSDVDNASIWVEGPAGLIAASPLNAHYFFVSRQSGTTADSALDAMQTAVEAALADLTPELAAHWSERLHVVAEPAAELNNWVGDAVQGGIGQLGLTIDRAQRVRAVGSLADVTRPDAAQQAAGEWPWARNMAYVANEARYYNFEADRQVALDAVDATEVQLWQGEVISQFADMTVTLPSADEMADFDTVELDFTQRCPDANALEAGNCGAWDYLAHLWLVEGEGEDERRIELGRHITTYHREGRWIVDITQALIYLADGGERTFRWEWAPEWNVQPTATWLTLRFSNQDRGERPIAITELWGGGTFNAEYNDDRPYINAPIPAEATRVELRTIITGHGAEAGQCAEFCNHQHSFLVGNSSYYREFTDTIGDDTACMKRVDEGVVPNQWGTWWFGRGGWCPGQEVDPWVVDVTADAEPGEDLNIGYWGYLGGRTPTQASGNIQMTSFVLSYAATE